MVAFQLDSAHQRRLDELAQSTGQDGATLARQVLIDYLDFQALSGDTPEAWAEASVALAPEIMEQEDWGQGDHGSK
jgi:predicted transcriptional regulator